MTIPHQNVEAFFELTYVPLLVSESVYREIVDWVEQLDVMSLSFCEARLASNVVTVLSATTPLHLLW